LEISSWHILFNLYTYKYYIYGYNIDKLLVIRYMGKEKSLCTSVTAKIVTVWLTKLYHFNHKQLFIFRPSNLYYDGKQLSKRQLTELIIG
jgi:hypothetical protein